MRTSTRLTLAVGLGLLIATACLDLGSSDEAPAGGGGGGGGNGGSSVGDGSWPDGAGGTAASGGGGATGGGGTAGVGAAPGGGGTPSGGGTTSGGGGTPSGGGGTTSGGGGTTGTGGTPSWTLYAFNWGNGTWSVPTALDLVWTGTNAPPATGIAAVAQLEHFDRLLVFTEAGKVHVRKGATWQPAVSTTTKFPALVGLTLGSVYHLASAPGKPLGESLTFVANPTAVLYDYNADDSVAFNVKVTMSDEAAPGPPQKTGTILWDFEVRDPSLIGTANYFLGYYGYSNGTVYQLDAAAAWKSWPAASAPFFAGKANAPTSTKLRAAWFDVKQNRAYFVGPG